MPELPDVEGYRRVLTTHLVGEVVRQVEVLDDSVIRNTTRRGVETTVRGRILVRVERRGKWLVAAFGGPALVFHCGMTGSLLATARGTAHDRFDRMVLVATAEVRYRDARKLGGIWLAEDEAAIDDIIGPQGPDARAVSHSELTGRLRDRRGAIKPVLMDQRVLAGLGNMLSDEVLWRAGVDPTRSAASLGEDELELLRRSLRDVLRRSVRAGKIPRTAPWLSSQRDAENPVCPRCGGRLGRRPIGGRTALSCRSCQR
ncbi:MAG: Fpg/Nei family DNA glycosylase [Ilumatobacteraceae bacterium]